jgi:peroxidase
MRNDRSSKQISHVCDTMSWVSVWIAVIVMAQFLQSAAPPVLAQQLVVGYYAETCPNVESIVSNAVANAYQQDAGTAPGLLRLHFHDCFVQGCDGSVLLDGPNSEKTAGPNFSLRGFEVVDTIKQALEAACPATVSCADILAYAARDSAVQAGGSTWDVPAGRYDGFVSIASEAVAALPDPTFTVEQLTNAFANVGLSQLDMLTLSGAHTIGRTHCSSILNRLYPTVDPDLDPTLATQLISLCPNGAPDGTTVMNLDPTTPFTFDNEYYSNLPNGKAMLQSDQVLWNDFSTQFASTINSFVGPVWDTSFGDSMVTMSNINIKSSTEGEIRLNCHVTNSQAAAAAAGTGQ